jgi:hypothetical protein
MNKIISVIVLAFVAAAPFAYAQEVRIEPVLRAGYESDDNATLNIITIEEADISGTLLEASARISYNSPKTTFSATPTILDRNYGEEDFDATEEFFDLRYVYTGQSSRFRFRGDYASELARTAERLDADFDIEDPDEIPDDSTGLVQIRGDRERIELFPSYSYQVSDASTIGFDVRYTDVSYEQQLAGLLNDFENTRANLKFSRAWSPLNTAVFGVTYRTYQASGSDSVSGYGVSGGIERRLSEKTRLRVIAGLENTELIGAESEVDPVGEITLTRQLETIRLLAQYRRVISGGGSGNLTNRDVININFTRDLTEKVAAGIGVRAYSTKSRRNTGATFDERDYVQLRAQFAWNFTETFQLEANYRYTVLDRGTIGESANSNNISLWFNWRPTGYSSTR